MSNSKYHVGQELWRHDVNENRLGGPERVVVSKVGRKLVTVMRGSWPEVFRIDTGRTNDDYGHGSLCTDEEHADHEAHEAALKRLSDLHLRFDYGGYARDYSSATLNAVADLLTHPATAETPDTKESK